MRSEMVRRCKSVVYTSFDSKADANQIREYYVNLLLLPRQPRSNAMFFHQNKWVSATEALSQFGCRHLK